MIRNYRIITYIRIGFIVIALFVVGMGIITYVNTDQVKNIQNQVTRTDKIIEHTNETLVNLYAFIGAERGYLISPHSIHRVNINTTRDAFLTHMEALEQLTVDNKIHQQRLKHVKETFRVIYHDLVEPLIIQVDAAIETNDTNRITEEFQTASSKSRFYLEEMTRLLLAISEEEREVRNNIVFSTMHNLNLGRTVNILGTIIILAIIFLMQKMAVTRIRKYEKAQQDAANDLQKSHERLTNVIEATRVGTWEWNIITGSVIVNEQWAQLLGYSWEELNPLNMDTWESLIDIGDLELSRSLMKDVYVHKTVYYDMEYRMLHKDGHWVWIHSRGRVTKWNDQGKALEMSGTLDDISKLKETQHYLYLETKRLETTLLSVGDAIIATDELGTIVMLNSVAEDLTGWTREEAVGKAFTEIFVTKNGQTGEKGDNPVARVFETGFKIELLDDTILVSRNGSERYIDDSAAPIKDDHGVVAGAILVFRDVTEKRKEKEGIIKLGDTDQLTQLLNRRGYSKTLKAFETNRRYPLTFMIADVNGLKLTNDAFGHDLGDQLLKTVAHVLTKESTEDDAVVRLGGDEFLILMPDTDELEAAKRLELIKKRMSRHKVGPLPVSFSLGFAVKEHHEHHSDMIFRQAESRMYRRKITESPEVKRKLIEFLLSWQHEQYEMEKSHSMNVEQLSSRFATYLGLSKESIHTVERTARYHDIGKVAVDKKLLRKEEDLDSNEWNDIRRHAEIGYNLLRTVPELYEIAEGVLHHHERWDGTGYPRGVFQENIPLASRIISICDTYDAIVGNRNYSNSRNHTDAIKEIISCSGTQFDPALVEAFVNMMSE